MTVGGWVLYFFIIAIIGGIAGGVICFAENKAVAITSIIIMALVSIGVLCGMLWWYSNTESGKRAMKTQESNFEGGITRNVKAYDAIGNLLYEYEGQFDISFNGDEQRILFDDEHGNRHVIYFKTGTVIVEELNDEEGGKEDE